jgi:hypothetical protein
MTTLLRPDEQRPLDFRNFYKSRYADHTQLLAAASWDVFLSSFNLTERVQRVFEQVNAARKQWLIHSEYRFGTAQIPDGALTADPTNDESDWVLSMLNDARVDATRERLCVDITGMMRPHLMFLVRYLASQNVRQFDVLYSEPSRYVARHHTPFGADSIVDLREVKGLAGVNDPVSDAMDLLIIGTGYEHNLVAHVAEDRKHAHKVQLFGFPPVQADFYQESFIRAGVAAEAVGPRASQRRFAPAYDPFTTASVLRDVVADERDALPSGRALGHVYLSPLSTRVQALGFALYYVYDCIDTTTSIIYPFAAEYQQRSDDGVGGLWRFEVELP